MTQVLSGVAPESAVFLSFLAPAVSCNQRCPSCYLTEVVREPVHEFELDPADFARFVEQFVEAGAPLGAVMFQGYEVTLPQSWRYLEAVFEVAKRHRIPATFITNGMLLDRWTERIDMLDPAAITISLDGADSLTNDRLRGLSGAFDATLRSTRSFLTRLPRFRERLSVASILYDDANVSSLRAMPRLLRDLGILQWKVGYELQLKNGRCEPAQPLTTVVGWAAELAAEASSMGVDFHTSDEFDRLGDTDTGSMEVRRLFDPGRLFRVDPLGYVRSGRQILDEWNPDGAARWDPRRDHAAVVSGWLNGPDAQRRPLVSPVARRN